VKDPVTLANYNANKVAIGGGIGADHVADLILNAYNPPQNALVQEICITLTRQKY
jgi:NADP-dependent 3-hydroxy acid dehydrogenase YdfG